MYSRLLCLITVLLTLTVEASETLYPSNPAFAGNRLYVSGEGLHSYNTDSRQLSWRALEREQIHEPISDGEMVFVGGNRGAYGLSAEDGSIIWRLTDAGALFSPVKSGKNLFIAAMDGSLHAVSSAQGEPLWHTRPGAGWIYPPVISHGLVVTGGQDAILWAVDQQSGKMVWKTPLPQELVYRPLLINSDLVVVATFSGELIAIDLPTGTERWRQRYSTPGLMLAATEEGLIMASMGGELRLIDPASGKTRWQKHLPGRVMIPPAEQQGRLMVLMDEGRYQFLNSANGTLVKQGKLTGEPSTATYIKTDEVAIFYPPGKISPASLVLLNMD